MQLLRLKKPHLVTLFFIFFSWECEVGKSARKTASIFRQHNEPNALFLVVAKVNSILSLLIDNKSLTSNFHDANNLFNAVYSENIHLKKQ